MSRMPPSAVVTPLDNAAALSARLASLALCDEIVMLDSGFSDATKANARRHVARMQARHAVSEDAKGYESPRCARAQ